VIVERDLVLAGVAEQLSRTEGAGGRERWCRLLADVDQSQILDIGHGHEKVYPMSTIVFMFD